jgi:hypothetical protein
MHIEWVNDGEPDATGEITVHITNNAGNRISTIKGKDKEELLNRALETIQEMIRTINRLKRPDAGRPGLKIERKTITNADRDRMALDITDPGKVVETVTEIVTAQQGLSPADVGKQISRQEDEDEKQYILRESWAFREATPDYYPVPQNFDALLAELKANDWPLTRNNLQLAYQTLSDRGTLILWPSEEEKQQDMAIQEINRTTSRIRPHEVQATPNGTTQPNTPTSRPRSTATGIRSSEANGTAPSPAPKRPKYTRADIERMSRAEYSDKLMNEPGFRQFVDSQMSIA